MYGNQVLLEKTKEWLGWRCSYRRAKPELCSKKRAVRQLRARAELLGQYIVKLPDADRHMEWPPDPDAHERHCACAKRQRAEDMARGPPPALQPPENNESGDSLDESEDSLALSESEDSLDPEDSSSTSSSASGGSESAAWFLQTCFSE